MITARCRESKNKMYMGAEGWLRWFKENINSGWFKLSEDFPVDVDALKIVTFTSI